MTYTIYIKPTNRCNLACKHCFNSVLDQTCSMTDQMIDLVIQAISAFARQHSGDNIALQFHGGEPILFDILKLQYFVDCLQKYKNITFCITTNLVYDIDDSIVSFFKRMNPEGNQYIMTSWDVGIRFNNYIQEEKWKENVQKLGKNGIDVHPIVCVTKQLIGYNQRELFDFFTSLGIHTLNFERITENGSARYNQIRPTNRETDNWLYNAWLASKKYGMNIPIFEAVEKSVDGFMLGCRARRCMKTVLTINPDGRVSACPNTADVNIGKIVDGKIVFNDLYERQIQKERDLNATCLVCKYFRYCNGDCCQLLFDKTGCPGLTRIYQSLLLNKYKYK